MIRPQRLLSLVAATLLVAGCPSGWLVPDDSDNSNILTTARSGSGGGVTFTGGSDTTSTTGGTAFSCTSVRAGVGTETDAATGMNPSSVTLSDPIKVMPLYLGSNFSLSLSNAKTAVVSLASLQESDPASVQSAWNGPGVATAYQTQSGALPELPQNRAERLVREQAKSLPAAPVPTTYRAQAGTTFSVGDSRTFKILDFNGGSPRSVATRAAFVNNAPSGQKGSFVIWVDARDVSMFQGSDSKLNTIVTELRDHIYKTDTCAFGSDTTIAENDALPASKRILLADDYVHFVFSRAVDDATLNSDGTWSFPSPDEGHVLGFFTLADLADTSWNKGKILYIASSATSRSLGDMFAVIAHEFQHLLFSCHRVMTIGMQNHIYEFNSGADTWLNEGLSMLAMMLNGYGPDGTQPSIAIAQQIEDFLKTPSQFSMTRFYGDNVSIPDAYGMVTLFAQYLNDRLGDAALKDFHYTDNSTTMFNGKPAGLTTADPTDLADRVLAKYGTSLGQMFSDFGVALLLDGAQVASNLPATLAARYSIRNVNLQTWGGPAVRTASTSTLSLKPYSLTYLAQKNLSGTVSLGLSNVSAGLFGAKLLLLR